ncbi:MAG: hypothetical protein JJ848_000520 [Prochlorococcus marinus CUG1439]|uniref:hypothetical protein n=1 Tax=Prochlorococcus sp. MIT 1314 TaxID=3096220 RepID=UPI001B1A4E9B|nr:hypothetical protein [Prochlorococcus sp. MIT 1314]MCR8538824.1 hypothetical protein [Prochlorococcus marinus CUG1439]
MKNMKVFYWNIGLLLVLIYIPLFLYSFQQKLQAIYPTNNFKKEVVLKKILAVKSGYYPTYYPTNLLSLNKSIDIYPIGSYPYTSSYMCDEGYGLITYRSDRFGLRNSDKKWSKINQNKNIFIIGDSLVQGQCVPKNSTITSNIENLTGENTLNLGMGGNTPYEYMASLKSIVKPIIKNSTHQNIVIILFFANDNILINRKKESLLNSVNSIVKSSITSGINPTNKYKDSFKSFIKNNYPHDSQEAIISRIQIKKENPMSKLSLYSSILTLYPIRITRAALKTNVAQDNPSINTIKLLAEICSNPCKPFVGYIPNNDFYDPHPLSIKYKTTLEEISKNLAIPFIDGTTVINKDNQSNFAPEGRHLSIEGYKKISELIYLKIDSLDS